MPVGAATRTGISRTSRPSSAMPDSCDAPPVRMTPAGSWLTPRGADLVAQQLEGLAHPRLDDLADLEAADRPAGILAEDADADLLVLGDGLAGRPSRGGSSAPRRPGARS